MGWRSLSLLATGIALIAGWGQAAEPDTRNTRSPSTLDLPSAAMAKDVLIDDEAQLEARLVVSSDPEPFVGIHFTLAEGWHLYWRNPGDTGLAPILDIDAPGFEAGEIIWPAPSVYEEADGLFTTFGYSDGVLLSLPLTTKTGSGKPADNAVVQASAKVLICRAECVPASFSLSSPVAPVLSAADQVLVDQLFSVALASAPPSDDEFGIEASAHWASSRPNEDETGGIALSLGGCAESDADCKASIAGQSALPFIPFEGSPFEFSNHRVDRSSGRLGQGVIHMEATRLEEGTDRLRGLVAVERAGGGFEYVAIDLPIEEARTQIATPPAPISAGGWFQIVLLAMLGGLILNGMPCVLPVLAIKVVAIADLAEKHPTDVRKQGLAYTAGVLGSMTVLASIVILLRRAGHSVGWGFQFQEPLFVAAITAVLVAFALNLFGVFEIDFGQGRLAAVGQTGSATRRSVFEGLLAVVLATPCTAPFLGTAVGFAFAASDFSILSIFLAIGLGLALPFLAVSFAPGFARFIPRSGPWMMKLRAGLGFCLLATAVWLLWVVGQSGGSDAVIGLVSMLLLLSFLLWAFGQAQPLRSPWLARAAGLSIALIAFAGFNWIEFASARSDGSAREQTLGEGWATYSEAAVAEALAAGRPAFVVFTADWCITCKVNEKTVLDRVAIREALTAHGHALFKADWTRRDEPIRMKLAEFGRAGVPLYLVYSPEAPNDPEVLSELLTQDEVRTALARSRASSRG